MQINGIGNSQIGNTYQNSNHMPNSATGKKEDDEASKRLEALGVKVELSFRQTPAQEKEETKEKTESEKPQETFSILVWFKKMWEVGIAWLKSIWNDEKASEEIASEELDTALEMENQEGIADVADARLLEETVLGETVAEEAVEAVPEWIPGQNREWNLGEMREQNSEEIREYTQTDKFRTSGVAIHTSGMQDSYNRYGQHSKLGVEPSGNMTIRK